MITLIRTLWSSFFIFRPGRESDSDAEDLEHAEKLRQVKAVLEEVVCLDIFVTFPFLCAAFFEIQFHVSVENIVLGKIYIITVLDLNSWPLLILSYVLIFGFTVI